MAKKTQATGTMVANEAQMVLSAATAGGEAQALAALFGVDWKALARCLAKSVKPRDLLKCIRSGDVLACLMESVDFAAVLECAMSQAGNGEPEFQAD